MRVSPSLYTPSPGKDASKNLNFYSRAPKRKHTELVFVLRPAHGSLGTSKFGEMAILGANRFNLEKSLFLCSESEHIFAPFFQKKLWSKRG